MKRLGVFLLPLDGILVHRRSLPRSLLDISKNPIPFILLSVERHCENKVSCPRAQHSVPVMLCYVMLCYVMLCYVMLCYVMLCYVMLCYVMLCYVMLCYVMLCYVMHTVLCRFTSLIWRPIFSLLCNVKEIKNKTTKILFLSEICGLQQGMPKNSIKTK